MTYELLVKFQNEAEASVVQTGTKEQVNERLIRAIGFWLSNNDKVIVSSNWPSVIITFVNNGEAMQYDIREVKN